ncbi:MAG: Bifunctional oligoribonuclease and PAP phosphatase NrnA [Syntrophus sp. PtaU1.Bin208]|nr:MAG: Bifunctional oligoribonuclease and PAP phosphatase NrnA [Syntrophus sp. PtaU1.Bin208]
MINRILEIIERSKTFLISAHERLDGDAVGSELALCALFRQMGKEADVYNQDATPENYRFLPGSQDIRHDLPVDIAGRYDAAFIVDCSDLSRVGKGAEQIARIGTLVNIDHHISNTKFCELSYVDPRASSTGELIYRLISRMGCAVSQEIATNLYAALLTDTGGFHYGSTGKETLIAAGNLVGWGANPQEISENIYENNPLAKIRLLAKALDTLTFDLEGRFGFMVVWQKDMQAVGAVPEYTEGFVDLPRSISGVEVSALFSEQSNGPFKVSFRSKGKVDVERVARAFDGGGHRNASACRIHGDFETVRSRVLDVIQDGF